MIIHMIKSVVYDYAHDKKCWIWLYTWYIYTHNKNKNKIILILKYWTPFARNKQNKIYTYFFFICKLFHWRSKSTFVVFQEETCQDHIQLTAYHENDEIHFMYIWKMEIIHMWLSPPRYSLNKHNIYWCSILLCYVKVTKWSYSRYVL